MDTNKTIYGLLSSTLAAGGEARATYGIALCEQSEDGCAPIATAVDLGTNREAITHLVETCNRLSLSPIHFSDVVEDFLAQ
jgi:hypothetical protein